MTYEYHATVLRVVDGDTLDLDVDLGFHIHVQQRVRLAGINAPEHTTDAGRAALEKLSALLMTTEIGVLFPKVTINSQKPPRFEKYGRWLADVTTSYGESVSELMLASGHAQPWDGKGKRPV